MSTSMQGSVTERLAARRNPAISAGNIVESIRVKKIDPRQIRDCSARAKRTRLALGYATQKAFCEASGVRYDLYSACERGQRRLSLDVALKIRDKLGIPLDWI